jgi:hypothetical protein
MGMCGVGGIGKALSALKALASAGGMDFDAIKNLMKRAMQGDEKAKEMLQQMGIQLPGQNS